MIKLKLLQLPDFLKNHVLGVILVSILCGVIATFFSDFLKSIFSETNTSKYIVKPLPHSLDATKLKFRIINDVSNQKCKVAQHVKKIEITCKPEYEDAIHYEIVRDKEISGGCNEPQTKKVSIGSVSNPDLSCNKR